MKLVAIDLSGHGQSSPTGKYSLPELAKFVADAAHQLDMDDAFFVGNSLGGHVVVQALPLLPKAKGVFIYGAPPLQHPPALGDAFLPHEAGGVLFKENLNDDDLKKWSAGCFSSEIDSETLESFQRDIRQADPKMRSGVLASVLTLQHADEEKILNDLDIPLCIAHGENDRLINSNFYSRFKFPTLWQNRVQMISGAGHSPQLEKPEAFNELLKRFILAHSQ